MPHFDPKPFLDHSLLIQDSRSLENFLAEASTEKIFAVDTESAGFYRYRSTVNLVQVCTTRRAAIIDPQALTDFSALKKFAENPDVEWVFHGADYDAQVLFRDLGVEVKKLFDTRIASVFVGLNELGLSSLAEKYLGFPLDKKLQRGDWSRRPLPHAMKKYALLDAICLVPIREALQIQLSKSGRLSWAREEFEELMKKVKTELPSGENEFGFIVKGANILPVNCFPVLKEVWSVREEISKQLDRAPFMIINNQALIEIARKTPRTFAGLSTIKGLHDTFITRYGKRFLEAIKKGTQINLSTFKLPPKPRRAQTFQSCWEGQLAGQMKELRNEVATGFNLPGSVLVPEQALEALSKARPKTIEEMTSLGVLRPWQIKLVGEKLLPLLLTDPPSAPGKKRRRRR